MSIEKEGWLKLLNMTRAHFFVGPYMRSLCGKWMALRGLDELDNTRHDDLDNCAECRKKREKLYEKRCKENKKAHDLIAKEPGLQRIINDWKREEEEWKSFGEMVSSENKKLLEEVERLRALLEDAIL